jgi:hypothetical protein
MRDLLEDAVITYRQDGEGLLTVAAPAILLGPILVLIGGAGLFAALFTAPLIAIVYVATYAACVRAAGLIASSEEPDTLRAYLGTLDRAVSVARSSAPVALLFAAVAASGLALIGDGHAELGMGVVLVGGLVMGHWSSRHAYEQPLILIHGLPWEEAREVSATLDRSDTKQILSLLGVVSLPLIFVAFISWGLSAAIAPGFGAALFAAAVGLWLPLVALTVTASCERFVDEVQGEPEPLPASAHSY